MYGLTAADVAKFWSKVIKTDGCWGWDMDHAPRAYVSTMVGGKRAPAHRVSYEIHKGPIPEGMLVDHSCHLPSCVNPDHLRLATHKQNMENIGFSSRNTSGYRGVSRAGNKWAAAVCHNRKIIHLGRYDTAEDAAAAAAKMRNRLYTHNIGDGPYESADAARGRIPCAPSMEELQALVLADAVRRTRPQAA